jgi:tRNA(adenine34) deaminase
LLSLQSGWIAATPASSRGFADVTIRNYLVTRRMTEAQDELWMEEALREAHSAMAAGEVPIGAVVVHAGRIVGRGSNRVIRDNDPSAHAEIVALRDAGRNVANYRLVDAELFVTVEPCVMCAGAIVHARVKRLVYGADDSKAGAVRSVARVFELAALNRRVEVTSGVLAGRCMDTLQAFFRERREAK